MKKRTIIWISLLVIILILFLYLNYSFCPKFCVPDEALPCPRGLKNVYYDEDPLFFCILPDADCQSRRCEGEITEEDFTEDELAAVKELEILIDDQIKEGVRGNSYFSNVLIDMEDNGKDQLNETAIKYNISRHDLWRAYESALAGRVVTAGQWPK
jgi:hypothetical protein